MIRAIAIGSLCLAALAGCKDDKSSNTGLESAGQTSAEAIKVEMTPYKLEVEKGDLHFDAIQTSASVIRGNLFYDNQHGDRVYISAVKEAGKRFSVDYMDIDPLRIFCNQTEEQEEIELCLVAMERFAEKCALINCEERVADWLKNRPSPEEYYL
ncbi:MAG: hypothetical protein KJ955_05325 [Nanoarchaeota archaeon]|nr:hypothetical protein [Nanoarchaeota archaeon]